MFKLPYRIRRRLSIKKIKNKVIVSKDPLEQNGVTIFISLLKDKNSKLEIAPISHERTISNIEKDIYIILSDRIMTVIKNDYSNDVHITEKVQDNLKERFNEVCEKRAQNSINKARKKIKHSLDKIIEEMNHKNANTQV